MHRIGLVLFLLLVVFQGWSGATSEYVDFVTIDRGLAIGAFAFFFAFVAVNFDRTMTNAATKVYFGLCFLIGAVVMLVRTYQIDTLDRVAGFVILVSLFGAGVFFGGLFKLWRDGLEREP